MNDLDCLGPVAGYWPSVWPAECGGPRRQKLIAGPGLRAKGACLEVKRRGVDDDRWPVMVVQRQPGELFLQGGTRPAQSRVSYGWVERIDPVTLKPLKRSPNLPSGGHNWCGAACVHANGDIYVVNGEYCHRLDPDLHVVAEHHLRTPNAHNGHIVLSDGNLVMKDIQLDRSRRSVFTVLDPDLKEVQRLELKGNSVGRFSAERVAGADRLYVTTETDIFRLVYRNGILAVDESWRASYFVPGEDQGFAWDSTLGGGSAWFMDSGETSSVRAVLSARPIGSAAVRGSGVLRRMRTLRRFGLDRLMPAGRAFGKAVHAAPQRVFRIDLEDASRTSVLTPFGLPGAGNLAPPLYDPTRRILVAFDTLNGRVGAWRDEGDALTPLWTRRWRTANQMSLFTETGELLLDDCSRFGQWNMVVADITTGEELARVDTRCDLPCGMWYAPGFDRDVYTSTVVRGGLARIFVTDS